MTEITLISVCSKVPPWISQGFNDYIQRLPNHIKFNLIEIPLIKRHPSNLKKIIADESAKIIKTIPSHSYVIALDSHGKPYDTLQLAEKFQQWADKHVHLCFLIGGPEGLTQNCLNRADFTLSLSNLTFPHPLARVIIAEQIYRVIMVANNHPYHR